MEKNDDDIIWTIMHFDDLSLHQLFDLLELRTRIFVLEQNCPYQEVDEKDKVAYHAFAYNKLGKMIAIARILPPGISYDDVSFGRVGIDLGSRGKGLAHLLTKNLIAFISSRYPSESIRISAQCYLTEFYEKHNFIKVSDEYDEDGIPHLEMLRSAN